MERTKLLYFIKQGELHKEKVKLKIITKISYYFPKNKIFKEKMMKNFCVSFGWIQNQK